VGAREIHMLHSSKSAFLRTAIIGLLYSLTASVFYMLFTTDFVFVQGLSDFRLWAFILLSPLILKCMIQLVSAPFYSFKENRRQTRPKMNPLPKVSVLIPAWNEEVGIIKTIQSVLDTQYQHLEVIVINDGSTDSTHQLVSEFGEAFGERQAAGDIPGLTSFKYLHLTNGGKAKALNCGLRQASGELVITVDADSVMDADAINQMITHFSDARVGAVAGNVIVGNRKKPIELMQQLEYLFGFFFKRADSNFNSVYVIGGAAAAYRKSVLEQLGGFDETIITEDVEMSIRILAHGYKTRYAANAVIYTEGPNDWQGLSRQRLRWKYGRLLTYIKHKSLFFSCQKQHNRYFTCFLMPLAIYAEIVLLFEGALLLAFYGFTIYANAYLPLAIMISLMSALVVVQVLIDRKSNFHRNLLFLAPVAWLVFYVIDAVELQALYRSLKRVVKREKIEWQRWVRVGILNKAFSPSQKVLDSE
jgi:poly-beta-1,6-N-acetyl-D-glucosamine synthase